MFDGWREVESQGPIESTKAFVAMWFSDEMRAIYDGAIKPAVEHAGYRPVRVDKIEHAGKIDDLIIAEIRGEPLRRR